jgi:hypothetical protein
LGSNVTVEDSAGSKEEIDEGSGGEWELETRRRNNKDILSIIEKYYIFVLIF